MTEDDFTFHHLDTSNDVGQNLELMRRVFKETDNAARLVETLIRHHPAMPLRNFFAIKHHGKIVAGLILIPVKWSVGGVPLSVAEMGCVATLTEYRRLGLQRRLINEFHKAAEQKYDLCAIEGIPYFYRQFGYEYALPLDEDTRISLDQLPEHKSTLHVRPFTDKDIPKAMQLLAQSQGRFYVHSIRDEAIWKMQQQTGMAYGTKFKGYVVEKKGKMLAYVRIDEKPESKELLLREATPTDSSASEAILRFLKRVGKQSGLETLISRMSYYEPLTEQLVALGAVKKVPPYAWQIRVVDYAKIFEKMKPLFEKRLADSSYKDFNETMNFNFYRYTLQVAIENGAITGIQRIGADEKRTMFVNPLVFTKLLLGYASREELEMTFPDFIIRQSHRQLIDILFPKLPSHIHSTY